MDIGVTVGDSVDRLEATADGFDFVELSIGESAFGPSTADTDALRSALLAAGVDLHVHLPFEQVLTTPVDRINEAIVAYHADLLAWASGLGAAKAVLHATVRNPHDVDQRSMFADQLSAIADAGRDAGVDVVVENVGHQGKGLPLSVLADIAEETGTPVCFDAGHAYMEDGHDGIERFLDAAADRIEHLHVHDARSRGDTHLPLGAGEIEYDEVAGPLDGFDGTVAIEVFTDDVPLLQDTADRIAGHFDADRGDMP